MNGTTRWRARPLQILLVAALALCLGMVLGPLAAGAGVNGAPPSLHVSQWSDPAQLSGVPGRETVIKVDGTYHMWYCPALQDENTLYHASSADPSSFPSGSQCTFEGPAAPVNLASVTVRKEGGTFYMITYGSSEKVFNIYTSADGTSWSDAGQVFGGSGLPDYNKIDGPYLLKDGAKYRLYFQVKTPAVSPNRYDIYTAESAATSLADIADGDTAGPDADFALPEGKIQLAATNNSAALR